MPSKRRRQLADIGTAAEIYGVHPRTIRRRIADGTIQGYRIAGSRAIRVDLDELEDALLQPIGGRA
ncbi:excisionase family DNA-binding protein [Mycolicibacterium sp. 3033]|nr:excisionase family DNA-binding protein [Mycolicibacterium aurantiacum]